MPIKGFLESQKVSVKQKGIHMTKLHIQPNREEFLTSFDSLFDRMIEKTMSSLPKSFMGFFGNQFPKVDVDYEDKIVIEAEISLSKDEVSVDLEKTPRISGSIKQSRGKEKIHTKRIKESSFKRSFALGNQFDFKKNKAEFENGLLFIEVPRKSLIHHKRWIKAPEMGFCVYNIMGRRKL